MDAHWSDADAYTQIKHMRFVRKFLNGYFWAALYINFIACNENIREIKA